MSTGMNSEGGLWDELQPFPICLSAAGDGCKWNVVERRQVGAAPLGNQSSGVSSCQKRHFIIVFVFINIPGCTFILDVLIARISVSLSTNWPPPGSIAHGCSARRVDHRTLPDSAAMDEHPTLAGAPGPRDGERGENNTTGNPGGEHSAPSPTPIL